MVLVWDLWPDPRLGFVHKCLQNDCYSVSKHFGLRPTDAVKSLVSEKQNIHKHLQYKYHKYLLKKREKSLIDCKNVGWNTHRVLLHFSPNVDQSCARLVTQIKWLQYIWIWKQNCTFTHRLCEGEASTYYIIPHYVLFHNLWGTTMGQGKWGVELPQCSIVMVLLCTGTPGHSCSFGWDRICAVLIHQQIYMNANTKRFHAQNLLRRLDLAMIIFKTLKVLNNASVGLLVS